MDRLNAPVLVDAYLNYFVQFKSVRGYTNKDHLSPYSVFNTGYAHCLSAGYLGEQALERAGYETLKREVRWRGWVSGAHGGLAIKLDNGNYMLVVDFTTFGNIFSGPYNSTDEID